MTDKTLFEHMEKMILTLMQQSKIPGLSLCVIQDDKEIYSSSFGAKSLKENQPVTQDTLFGIGSITKSFTTMAIMQLAEQGKLDINDPISKYLPFDISMEGKPITILHLMSHSSGMPNLGVAEVLLYRLAEIKETFVPLSSFNDVIRHMKNAKDELIDEPLKRYFYFNGGFLLLGLIIEKVTEITYEDYIRESILKPLKMERSLFTKVEYEKASDKLTGYAFFDDKFSSPNYPFDPYIYAAGGLLTSVNEMKNYTSVYLNNGKFDGKQLLKPESIQQLFKGQIERQPGFFGKEEYASGWGITKEFFDETLVHHGGSIGTSSAYLALIPKKKIGVIVMGNIGNSQGTIIAQSIIAMLLGKNFKTDHPALRIEFKLKKYPGEYQTYKGITKLSIVKRGLVLYGKQPDKETIDFPIIPVNDDPNDHHFWVPQGANKYPVEFLVDDEKGTIIYLHERNAYHKIK
ncbi:MAG: serine hydrolase [Candidatus Heimdallarchaeota archaeon]